jgi:hypothetical protein
LQHQIKLGQVGGLATSIRNSNQLFVFHRGTREWNEE